VTLAKRGEVIFVGGASFSGVDVVGRLLAARPDAVAARWPLRVHTDDRAIPALLTGRIGLEDFVDELPGGGGEHVPKRALEAAIADLRRDFHTDPLEACRELFWAVARAAAGDPGDRTLVEASTENIRQAQTLARLVPDARFVHVVRDGRDVAAAMREADAGPRGMTAALASWVERLREAEDGVRGEEDGAPYAIPEERVAVVLLDELASTGRETAHRDLLDALALEGEPEIPEAVESELEAAAIGRGRWRRHARGPARWWVRRGYERALGELEEDGNHAAVPLARAYEELG
jgi:hypothetical protein